MTHEKQPKTIPITSEIDSTSNAQMSNATSEKKVAQVTTNSAPNSALSSDLETEKIKSISDKCFTTATEIPPLSPPPSASINISAPVIPLLTPPTPPLRIQNNTQPKMPSILQTNDLNVLNSTANSSESSASSSAENCNGKPLIAKNDIQTKMNCTDFSNILPQLKEGERILENIEARINTIKEANMQKQQYLHQNGKSETSTPINKSEELKEHVLNGHTNYEAQNGEKIIINEKENKKNSNGIKASEGSTLPITNENNTENNCTNNTNNQANNVVIADENSSSSSTSTLTSSSSSSTSPQFSENEIISQEDISGLQKRKHISDTNDIAASPNKKNSKLGEEMGNCMQSKENSIKEETSSTVKSPALDPTISDIPSSSNSSSSLSSCSTSESNDSTLKISNQKNQNSNILQQSNNPESNNNSQTNAPKSSSDCVSSQHQANNQPINAVSNDSINNVGDYMCEWNNCKRYLF